jgi:hypothetical protein
MTQEEFTALHGQAAWDRMVRPRQEKSDNCQCSRCRAVRQHANATVHWDIIGPVLSLLGFQTNSLLAAQGQLAVLGQLALMSADKKSEGNTNDDNSKDRTGPGPV